MLTRVLLHVLVRRFFSVAYVAVALVLAGSFLLLAVTSGGLPSPWPACPERGPPPEQPAGHFLVVLVVSAPANEGARDTLRDTWFRSCPQDGDVRCYFVLGTAGLPKDTVRELEDERDRHHDLLLLPEVTDTFANLTLKVLTALVWADEKAGAQYVLKCDDDTFVRLPKIVNELKEGETAPSSASLYWGFFDGRAAVQKKGKWQENDWILCDHYLPYALGGGYVLGSRLLHYITRNRHDLQLFYNEDVSVGTWLAPLKDVRRVHDPRFDTEYKSRGCHNSYLVTHKKSAAEMAAMWEQLRWGSDRLCPGGQETRLRLSYRYDWLAPPSLCCRRHDPSIP
ncbi:beta-1,3-galactosyltransferase 6-like [Schistocerca serialis cubense]|uniref:beta-1,3-galactosyltransferase 6-like n=1 Tax=Schistocerca serialis cubense TaxID=2023355 RepID=UPI00214EA560|nr:beta-1,3-galactosyltransferase 6-like [Schistocerca serialis cubense]